MGYQVVNDFNKNLAEYFASKPLYLDEPQQKKPNVRKLVEQPWQQTKGEMWDEVTETLCNLDFIQAKAAAKMTYELGSDINAALEVIPDNAENIRKEKERQARMDKYTHDLIACAKGEISVDELEIPESITPWTEEQTETEIERIKNSPTNADLLKDFLYFLGNESSNLHNYASEFAHFTYQQAWNYTTDGPVGKASEKLSHKFYSSLLCRSIVTRPNWNPIPTILETFKGLQTLVNAVAVTPDGRKAISISFSGTLILWDLTNGEPLKTVNDVQLILSTSVSITPDGKKAVSSSMHNNICFLWNLNTGEKISTLKGHTDAVSSISITPDGKLAVSGSWDKTCILWDLTTGQAIHKLMGHHQQINDVSVTSNGKWAITGSSDNNCILWDLVTKEIIYTLKGHTANINSVSITPDGKRAISGSADKTCILWDLNTGEILRSLCGHTHAIKSVKITPDGKLAFSASWDYTCIIWDLTTGVAIKTIVGNTGQFHAVSITSTGNQLFSGHEQGTCFLWDLNANYTLKNYNGQPRIQVPIDSISIISHMQQAYLGFSNVNIKWNIKSGLMDERGLCWPNIVNATTIAPNGEMAIMSTNNDMNRDTQQKHIPGPDDNICILFNITTGEKHLTLKKHTNSVRTISITVDGTRAISGSDDKTCILWDLTTGAIIHTLIGHTANINSVSINSDGKTAISGSDDKSCILWNLQTGKVLKILKGHNRPVNSVFLSPDGKMAISGSSDNSCILWDLTTGQPRITFWLTDTVSSVSISPDGQRAISCSHNMTCILLDLENGKKLACFAPNSKISAASFFSNGILIGCETGEIITLNVNKKLLCPGIAFTTLRQVWDYKSRKYQEPSAVCPLCGYRFAPPASVMTTIIEITKKAGLRIEQSPCLELADEAWEHPGLLTECPSCHEPLKFNPFFGSDQKGIEDYLFELEKDREWQIVFENAENAFLNEIWDEAFKLYLKLISAEKFDASYMRYNMALCRINSLDVYRPEIIANIEVLKRLLQEAGENERVQLINDKLIERLKAIKEAEKPWWKKLF